MSFVYMISCEKEEIGLMLRYVPRHLGMRKPDAILPAVDRVLGERAIDLLHAAERGKNQGGLLDRISFDRSGPVVRACFAVRGFEQVTHAECGVSARIP